MEAPANERIPRMLHYVWVGGAKQPALIRRCIESWKTHAPGYEIRLWNEENSPMEHPYVKEMYRQKKWAFVSDYIRFWALEREGGVYLDTDMELLAPIDRFLADGAFFGKTKDGYTACGIVGSVPHHPAMQAILGFYDKDTMLSIENSSPKVVTRILEERAFKDVSVYEPSYFYPCDDGERCGSEQLKYAYANHHWAESWVSHAWARKILRRIGLMPLLQRLVIRTP